MVHVGDRIALRRHMLRLGFPDVRGTVLSKPECLRSPHVLVVKWDDGRESHILDSNVLLVSRIPWEAV